MPVEPPAGPVDVVVAEQNVAAPAVPGRPAPVGAHAPGEVTAGHARGDGQHQVEVRTGHRAADRAPANSMVSSDGTGMQADSASINTRIARYP